MCRQVTHVPIYPSLTVEDPHSPSLAYVSGLEVRCEGMNCKEAIHRATITQTTVVT